MKEAPSERDLTAGQRRALEVAHHRLRDAVAAYESYLAALVPGQALAAHSAGDLAAAQVDVDEAERELWRLREEFLGWIRPSWAPSASLEADWFSADDAIYDEVGAGPVK
jgi:hypothetical protein